MISDDARHLVARFRETRGSNFDVPPKDVPCIHVDEVASRVALWYEKLRGLVEYREAHLLRRETIKRILRRRMLIQPEFDFAEGFIKDLIRTGHLPNDQVPETRIGEVQKVLDDLRYLLSRQYHSELASDKQMYAWVLEIFVPTLEDELFKVPEDALIANFMFKVMRPRLSVRHLQVGEKEADMQLFIAVQRAILRLDDAQLQHILLRSRYPDWGKMGGAELEKIIPELARERYEIQALIRHPASKYFLKMCQREKTPFQILGGLVFEGATLEGEVDSLAAVLYEQRYAHMAGILKKLAFFSVLSFLISKILVAFILEIPLDHFLGYKFSPIALAINVLFPPVLMAGILLFIRPPSAHNFQLVKEQVQNLLAPGNERKYAVIGPDRWGNLTVVIMNLAYLSALAAVLYGTISALSRSGFSPASTAIFLLFTSMIIATGVRISNRSKEMSMERRKSTVLGFIADLVIVPFTAIGKWVLSGLSRFNIVAIGFDLFIELPLGFFVEFVENFRAFMTAKRDEIA